MEAGTASERCPRARRLAAGAALVALPVGAVAGCGAQTAATKESVQTSMQKAAGSLSSSEATTVVLHLSDPRGNLRKAAGTGDSELTDGQGDLLVGTTVSITVDPVTGTVGPAQAAAVGQTAADQLRLVNLAVSVQSDGNPVAQLRVVGGDPYANASLDRLDAFAGRAGAAEGVSGRLEQLAASSPDLPDRCSPT